MSNKLVLLAIWSIAFLATGFARAAVEEEPRHALVIGNADYVMSPLKNPVNDAADMSKALRRLGFDVTTLINADLRQMRRAAIDFGKKLQKGGGVGLFYYAGHGMQVDGENFLIPLEAEIEVEDHVPVEAMSVNQILARMGGARNRMNIVVLDACRNNPLSRTMRSGVKGLAQLDAPFGTYISFATAPGQTAFDGDGRNGLYTSALLKALDEPGMKIEETFKQVRKEVVGKTESGQVPWTSSSIVGDFVFQAEPDTVELEFEEEKPAQQSAPAVDPRDTALWNAIQQGGQVTDYQTYLSVYPDGVYAELAKARITNLSQQDKERGLALVKKDAEVQQLQDQLAALRKREERKEEQVAAEERQIAALQKQIEQLAAQQAKLAEKTPATSGADNQVPAEPTADKQASLDASGTGKVLQQSQADLSIESRLEMHLEWYQMGLQSGQQNGFGDWQDGKGKIKGFRLQLKLDQENKDEISFQGKAGRKNRNIRGILKRVAGNVFKGETKLPKKTGYILVKLRLKVYNFH